MAINVINKLYSICYFAKIAEKNRIEVIILCSDSGN